MSAKHQIVPPFFRLSAFFFALFFVLGVYLPFFPVWLAERGLNEWQIGIVLATPMAMRIVSTPLTAAFADRFAQPRIPLLIYASLCFAFFTMLGLLDGFVAIAMMMGLIAVFWMPLAPLSDAMAFAVARRDGVDYGRMRLWGSIAFILANLGIGWLVARLAGGITLPILVASFAAVAVAAFFLPRTTTPAPAPEQAWAGRSLLRQPLSLAFVLAAGLVQASHAMLYGFGSLHWQSLGLDGTRVGVLWAIGVIAEIVLFSVSGRVVARLGPLGMVALAASAAIVRWSIFPFVSSFAAFLVVQLLHGLTFAAAHLGLIHHVANSVPEHRAGSAQGFAVTVATALMAIATSISGPLYRAFGAEAFFTMAGIGIAALLLCAAIARLMTAQSAAQTP